MLSALFSSFISAQRARGVAIIMAALFALASSAHAAGRQILRGTVPEAIAESKATGRVPASTRLSFAVGLPLRRQKELADLLHELADPASPNYRHYLSSEQFAQRFGPSEQDYQTLADFFRNNGFSITGMHPNRTILDVTGVVSDVERVFQVNMTIWNHPARGVFYAPDRDPSLDAGVAILGVTGLDNFVVPRPMDLRARTLGEKSESQMATGSGPDGLFIGGDFRGAYAPSVTLSGSGQSIGLFELDGFYAGDIAANFAQAGLPAVPVDTVLLDEFDGTPGSGNVEVTLDIMMAAYMAPGASRIIVYEGTNWNDVLNRMATDNLASTLSSSWTFSPTNATTEQIFEQMIAQGQSMLQASGDSGGYKGVIYPPADDPNLTVVGGTDLVTTGASGAWQSETAWAGSGGGVSTVWPIPSYQQGVNVAAAGGSATMRNTPDVAMIADTQVFLICNNGQWVEVGGTSVAAPLWAGFAALANQQAAENGKPRVGFLNPAIYGIGGGANYQSDLHDIVSGNNGVFSALPGYDLATGWGSPAGQPLIDALTGVANTPGFSLSSSAASLSIAAGASGESTITISPQQGFNGAVSLSATGLPAGVTASFSPASTTSTSTLTLSAAGSVSSAT
jgi:subtilase family serine protease